MSKKQMNVCNECGKRVDDRYTEKGWIHIEGINSICISTGIVALGDYYKTRFKSFSGEFVPLDFCDTNCLVQFLHKIGI